MARIRSIHPGLTSDEAFMSMSMATKAAWMPLWMQCDDHGIFEWKPIVLKALIFPADNIDFASVLDELVQLDCIKKIDIDGKPHGVVRNFARYQRPKNPSYRYFKAEELPADMSKYIGERTCTPPVLPQSSPSTTENPPQRKEEGGRVKEEKKDSRSVGKPTRPDASRFEEFWLTYPRRDGPNPRKPAEERFNSLVKTGVDPQTMIDAARELCEAERKRGNIGTRFIPQAITWLNQQRWSDHAAVAMMQLLEASERASSKVHVKADTPQWRAWAQHLGREPPQDRHFGWSFDSEWPPGHEATVSETAV